LDVNEGQKFEITWRKGRLSNAKLLQGLQSGIKHLTVREERKE